MDIFPIGSLFDGLIFALMSYTSFISFSSLPLYHYKAENGKEIRFLAFVPDLRPPG